MLSEPSIDRTMEARAKNGEHRVAIKSMVINEKRVMAPKRMHGLAPASPWRVRGPRPRKAICSMRDADPPIRPVSVVKPRRTGYIIVSVSETSSP